jgi:serine/threonine protein kinase
MAPEQLSGHEVDGRADLFSLGVILYRIPKALPRTLR